MRFAYPIGALALALAVPSLVATSTQLIAQPAAQQPGVKDKSRVTAGTYAADPGHSLVIWEVGHFGFSDYTGIFGDISGNLTIDPANLAAAKVDVTIPIASVTTASAGLTKHLLAAGKDGGKADFFGPTPEAARFVSTAVVLDDDGDEAKVTGNLTLNGVTRPVTLDVDFHGAGHHPMMKKDIIGFSAEAKIKRSDFGITYALPFVSDEVELDISAEFIKQ